jgi:2,3-bisphosphoglycerate-dependent phosphoglycerate mutase
MSLKYRLLIARHGESIWNHDSKFTGWTNIPLSKKGVAEAYSMSESLIKHNLFPNIFFTSTLDRAIDTGNIIKNKLNKDYPLHTSWRLNEKHYGTLEGVPRKYIRDIYGEKFTQMMRSNYNMKPPIIKDHDFKYEYSSYKNCYFETIKNGESKEDVLTRFLPYYENDILYTLTQNKFPLIVSHKHTVRVLMKHLLKMNEEEFEKYELPNKKILNIELDEKFNYISSEEINY